MGTAKEPMRRVLRIRQPFALHRGRSLCSSSTSWSFSPDALNPPEDSSYPRLSQSGHALAPLTEEQKRKAVKALTAHQRDILVRKQAEEPHAGYTANGFRFDTQLRGTYVCLMGGLPLFHS